MIQELYAKSIGFAKGDGFDKDAFMKYVDKLSDQAYWKATFKAAAEQCLKEVVSKKEEILRRFAKAPYNIKEDQCNPIYFYLTSICLVTETFKVNEICFIKIFLLFLKVKITEMSKRSLEHHR